MQTTETRVAYAIAAELADYGRADYAAAIAALVQQRDQLLRQTIEKGSDATALMPRATGYLARHADAVTHHGLIGWDTVLGYLAKYHPDVLDDVDYRDPVVTARDGWWLAHRAREKGIEARYVDAPSCLQNQGIATVRVWPLALLQKRWG